MTETTKKMIQRGHVRLITRNPLTLQGITPTGIRYLLDTKDLGIAGFHGREIKATTIEQL